MKRMSTALAIVLVATLGATASPVLAKDDKKAAAPAGKPSKGAGKILSELQALDGKKDWAALKAKIPEAEAVQGRNSFDNYFIGFMKYKAGIGLPDDALTQAGLEVLSTSEFTAADQKPSIYRSLLALADKAKDSAKAKVYAEQYLALAPDDVNVLGYVGQQALRAKDYPSAEKYLLQAIKVQEAKGQPADEDYYTMLASLREQSKSPAKVEAYKLLAKNYPSGRNWAYLLEDFQTRSNLNGRTGIDLFRLMSVSGALLSGGSVIEAAQVALDAGVPGDAKAIIARARATSALGDRTGDAAAIEKTATASIAADDPAAKQEAGAKTPDRLALVGQLYLSLGNYPKAAEVLKNALAKGVRNKEDATIRLGIAQLMGGDAAAAKATWAGVTGDPKLVELASLWSLYADVKK